MKNLIKRTILLILILVILVIGIVILFSFNKSNNQNYESKIINTTNSQTLQIENTKITNLTERSGNDTTAITNIKNISDLNLSQIIIYYDELDKNENTVSDSKIIADVTLVPNDVMEIQFEPKDYTNTIVITGYSYIVEDCLVKIDLKENETTILENNKYLENSKNYEVISIKKINKTDFIESDSSYGIEIENISQRNLGNIILKVAELNEDDNIIRIDHITYNSILKPSQNEVIISSISDPGHNVKILGYTYDDIEKKSNVDIDLITHRVNIIDNK